MQTDIIPEKFVKWFRGASPYINAHRDKTFVIMIGGNAIVGKEFPSLIHDIALLGNLGIKLVLVFGLRPQIEGLLFEKSIKTQSVNGLRITCAKTLASVTEAAGKTRISIEALFSMGLANSPMAGYRTRVTSGNFVTARPYGVVDGIDFMFTGKVRRVDTDAINYHLNSNSIVIVPPLGYSPTGEVFSLSAAETAAEIAIAVGAEKLIYLQHKLQIKDNSDIPLREITTASLESYSKNSSADTENCLKGAAKACDNGVARAHLLDSTIDGTLLQELFTIDGVGTMVSSSNYELLRSAGIDDIAGIIELISPLEESGALVKRSRELLELEIDNFLVVERDGVIIGCSALYHYNEFAELGCFVIDEKYILAGRATTLLEKIEKKAIANGVKHLFVLTTHTAHWFQERGFIASTLEKLPMEKQQMYNFKRGSKVFIKKLL
ncbi:MAG: amino-acid N-acetyltransferase [Gammaproteobacteria bacterium]|nr:MAG: amino-acid N-acetyltransferase [Gammaproteobacteria bacterium]